MKPRLPKLFSKPAPTQKKSRKNTSQLDAAFFECSLFTDTDAQLAGRTLAQEIVAGINGCRRPDSARAVRRLVSLATEVINRLEYLWREGNPHIREVARDRIDWPVLAGNHNAILKRNSEWIDDIQLGHEARNRLVLAQLPAKATPARLQTLHLLELVNHIQQSAVWGESIHEDLSQCDNSYLAILRSWLRQDFTPTIFSKIRLTWPLVLKIKKLPLLGPEKESVTRWQNATLEFLSINCEDRPSSIPELCALGEHRRFHPYPASTSRSLLAEFVTSERQSENISREIRDIIKDEIRKIGEQARKLKTTRPAKALTPSLRKSG